METYRINKYLTLKCENGKTNTYIKGKLFQQCKSLLLKIRKDKTKDIPNINSIDEAAEKLNYERKEDSNPEIEPNEEFWAHCSNLQVWAEHDYDSRLMHSNLAFPLLKKLSEVGNLKAKNMFKEEIIYRFYHGTEKVQEYLIEEGYLDLINDEEKYSLIESESDLKALKKIENELGKKIKIDIGNFYFLRSFIISQGKIVGLKLCECGKGKVPKAVQDIKNLEKLVICADDTITEIPSWIGNLTSLKTIYIGGLNITTLPEAFGNLYSLEKLGLSINNKLELLPESFGNLVNLKELDLTYNSLKSLPESFGNLSNLQKLNLNYRNLLTSLPDSFGNLKSLEKLSINENKLKSLPESVGRLKSLRALNLKNNSLKSLPDSMGNLKSLRFISLSHNNFEEFPECLIKCESLKVIYLSNNKIKEIPQSITRSKSLEDLALRNNEIKIFPDFLENVKSLKEIDLMHNPIRNETVRLYQKIKIII